MTTYPETYKDRLGRKVKIQRTPDECVLFHYWGESDNIKLITTQNSYETRISIYGKSGCVGTLENNVLNLFSSSNSFYIKGNRVKFTTRKEIMNEWRQKLSKT